MTRHEYSIITSVFLFKELEESVVHSYIDECRRISYSPGEVIHSAKVPSHGIGIILSGKARIVSGRGDTLLRILNTGDIFGAASVFSLDKENRTAVIASGNCAVLIISKNIIKDILKKYPETAVTYIRFLSDRIDFLNSRISALAAGDAEAKVAGFILSLNYDTTGTSIIDDSLTNISSKLNIGRASLYRTIDRFIANDYICRNKNMLTILDRNSLEDIVFKKDSGNSR